MSSLKINRETLNKLNHENMEIRLRTLHQLSSKLYRAFELNENVDFKPSDLCKQLIRWFGNLPPQQPLKVLNLLKSVLKSSKYGSEVIKKLGSERLIKELRKIQTLFDSQSSEFGVISEIKEYLRRTQSGEKCQFKKPLKHVDDLIDHIETIKLEDLAGFCATDYEAPWSLPSSSDFTSMKFLSDILINDFAANSEIENAVCHLQLTIADYPPEYLLQAPHIFHNLLQLYDERKSISMRNVSIENVALALLQFLIALDKRLKMSRNSLSFYPTHQRNTNAKFLETPRQLKLETALKKVLDASIFHLELHVLHGNVSPVVWEVIFMVLKILKTNNKNINMECLNKAASIATNLSTKYAETDHCARLRLHHMLLIFLIQDIAEMDLCPNSLNVLEVFEPIIRDYTMNTFFPKRYQATEMFILKADPCFKEKFYLVKVYEKAIDQSIQILKNNLNISSDNITDGLFVSKVLDVLKSKDLVDVLFAGIIKNVPFYRENSQRKAQAMELLLRLLNVTVMPLKIHIYDKLAYVFKRHIGCLMTGERYIFDCSNTDLLKAQIVGVPLNTELLKQLVCEGFESNSEEIQGNCCKMIELLLKSQNLFHIHWYSILPTVVPLMPLLNCYTFSKEIMDLLVKLFDPDLRQLPFTCVLQGNIGFLFHANAARRSEALTRLVYILNNLKNSETYTPNLVEISDTIPNDICYATATRKLENVFCDQLPIPGGFPGTLNNLLHLLESPDVEPLIRKTTLMQINVLCNNWYVTAELCKAGALYLILQALENALQKSSKSDYADAVVPVIGILSKVMLYDASVRCELSETPNIYVLLLRALFMFHNDIQVRQDASLCLFLLFFSSYIVSTQTSTEVPMILNNIKMPLNGDLRPVLGNQIFHEMEKYSKVFGSKLEETQYTRLVVASSYCAGLENVTQKTIHLFSKLDITEDLKLTSLDVRFIRATQPNVSLLRLLKAAVNATDHKSLIQICTLLKLQLIVPQLRDTFCINDEFCGQINGIFKRLLQMPPGSDDDFNLYQHLLDIAIICIKIPLEAVALEILKNLHKDPGHALITMITQPDEIPFRIYSSITKFLTLLIDEHKSVLQKHVAAIDCGAFYIKLFDLFLERCLQLFETRDLQRVRCLLSLMVAVSSCELNISDELTFFYCRRFVQLSLGLKSFTQTGAQWHRDCLLIVLKLSDQMQNCSSNFRLTGSFVKYLSGLCGHNDIEVRTLAWSILNVTAKTKSLENIVDEGKNSISGTELLVTELSFLPGGFIACCLSTMLDTDEAMSVRHLAGQLLAVVVRTQGEVKEIEEILDSHNFTRLATEALTTSACVLEKDVPKELDISSSVNLTTTDLISCYSLICFELSRRSPTFLQHLCTKPFMFKLYEILKQPPPLFIHFGYLNMVGHICRLYALCYSDNFVFLKRTICRDAVWLDSFCEILFKIVAPAENIYNTINMLQLLLILCNDTPALEHISTKLQEYSIDIVRLFQNALNVKNVKTSFQRCSLSVLSLILIKSQRDVDLELGSNILDLLEGQNISIIPNARTEILQSDDMESYSAKICRNKEEASNPKDGKYFNIFFLFSCSVNVCTLVLYFELL